MKIIKLTGAGKSSVLDAIAEAKDYQVWIERHRNEHNVSDKYEE